MTLGLQIGFGFRLVVGLGQGLGSSVALGYISAEYEFVLLSRLRVHIRESTSERLRVEHQESMVKTGSEYEFRF